MVAKSSVQFGEQSFLLSGVPNDYDRLQVVCDGDTVLSGQKKASFFLLRVLYS